MIKLVVSDIDGTLVPDGSNRIDPEYYDIVRELKHRGILFVAASGRQYESMQRLFLPVEEDIIFVADNGANVMLRGENISVNYIEPELAEEMVLFLRELPECEILLSTPESAYLETDNPELVDLIYNNYKFKVERVKDLLAFCGQTIKIAAYRKKGIQPVFETITGHFGDRMNVMISGAIWADCVSRTTDKGNALEKLQHQMGITADETMAFGDNCNDIQMLAHAAQSYAVVNANPRLKEVARYLAPPFTENGVARTIREQLLMESANKNGNAFV